MTRYTDISEILSSPEIKEKLLLVLGDGSEAGLTENGVREVVDYLFANEPKRFIDVRGGGDGSKWWIVETRDNAILQGIHNAMAMNREFKSLVYKHLR